jgi:hypothetical protein
MKKYKPVLPRLLDRHVLNEPTGCWEWTGHIGMNGYGVLIVKNKRKLAHRASYEEFNGKIADGLVICHKCDNPKCINPMHLFAGTQKDNIQDMVRKGRRSWVGGTRKPTFTDADRLAIAGMRGAGMTYPAIGKIYQKSKTQIRNIHLRLAPVVEDAGC